VNEQYDERSSTEGMVIAVHASESAEHRIEPRRAHYQEQ
jgi:hypothetical protein